MVPHVCVGINDIFTLIKLFDLIHNSPFSILGKWEVEYFRWLTKGHTAIK